jgi:hypothetical protein
VAAFSLAIERSFHGSRGLLQLAPNEGVQLADRDQAAAADRDDRVALGEVFVRCDRLSHALAIEDGHQQPQEDDGAFPMGAHVAQRGLAIGSREDAVSFDL